MLNKMTDDSKSIKSKIEKEVDILDSYKRKLYFLNEIDNCNESTRNNILYQGNLTFIKTRSEFWNNNCSMIKKVPTQVLGRLVGAGTLKDSKEYFNYFKTGLYPI